MSITNTCLKILKKCAEILKEDGYTDNDVKETFEYSKNVINKSKIPEKYKTFLLGIFDKVDKG